MRKTFLAVFAAGVVGLVLHGLTTSDRRAFTLGVVSNAPVVQLAPADEVCQQPIDVPAGGAFNTVRLRLGTYHRLGPRVRVTVRRLGGRTIASGTLPGGYADIAHEPWHDVRLERVREGAQIAVCIENEGDRRVAVYGGPGLASRATTVVTRQGDALDADLDLVFLRSEARSALSVLPLMFERASLFRPPGVGPWLYWTLLALLVVAAPALLVRAGSRAISSDARRLGERSPAKPPQRSRP